MKIKLFSSSIDVLAVRVLSVLSAKSANKRSDEGEKKNCICQAPTTMAKWFFSLIPAIHSKLFIHCTAAATCWWGWCNSMCCQSDLALAKHTIPSSQIFHLKFRLQHVAMTWTDRVVRWSGRAKRSDERECWRRTAHRAKKEKKKKKTKNWLEWKWEII